jgi:16S rRNA (guanine527-N7)-methyltransferase
VSARERLDELVARHRLPAPAAPRLWSLLELLARDEHAPSAVREPERGVEVHIADSLSALDLPVVRAAKSIADLGSGAGFPGIPLAIAVASADVTLVESARRKCDYLARALREVHADNAQVVCARAEEWQASVELVTVRALGELALLCEYAAPLLVQGGSLVAWKGAVSAGERLAGERAAQELGLEPRGAVRVSPYPGSATHHLHVYQKIADTPARFPRRPGAARKHPLGQPR